MVLGALMAVTCVPRVSQCALIHNIAVGVGSDLPRDRHLAENTLSSMAFIGLPCPTNNAGMGLFWLGLSKSWAMLGTVMSLMAKGMAGNSDMKSLRCTKYLL
jgi:hypothetical protein